MMNGLRYSIAFVLAFALMLTCAPYPRLMPLFDGSSLDGWEVKTGPPEIWRVENGVIVCDGGGVVRGWLGTKNIYRDFVLTVEWKVEENGNTGVFLRVGDDPEQNPAYDAIELQMCDDTGSEYRDLTPENKSGGIYAVIGASKSMYRGPNTWNRYVVTCIGPSITLDYNGEKVLDVDMRKHARPFKWFDRMRPPLIARSREGYIALQTHGSRVWFRNIRIRELSRNKVNGRG